MRGGVLKGVLLPLLFLTAACSHKVYVPVESRTVRTDTVRTASLRADTVIDRDTVVIENRGDTVALTTVRWRYRWRERTDTLWRTVTERDTVRIREPVGDGSGGESVRSRTDDFLRLSGAVALTLCAVVLVICLRRRLRG